MRERLTYSDGSSNKFWEVHVEGAGVRVTYGKLGTNGQSRAKTHASAAAARADAAKQVAEKLKKGYQRVGGRAAAPAQQANTTPPPAATGASLPDVVSLPDEVRALIGARCFKKGREHEDELVLFDWAAIPVADQNAFVDALFGDCEDGDFAGLLDLHGDPRWNSTRCVPFALFGVASGPDVFRGGASMPQFDRLLLIDAAGAVSGIAVDGSAVPARKPAAIAGSWDKLGIQRRGPAAPAGTLPAVKPTRRVKLVGSLGDFREPSRTTPSVYRLSASSDGGRVALTTHATRDDPARLYTADSGELLRTFGPASDGVILAPDGSLLVTAHRRDAERVIVAWDTHRGVERWRRVAHRGGTYIGVSMAISPDGKTLVTSCDGGKETLRAHRLRDGAALWSASLGRADVYAAAVAISPDGKTIATGGSDETLKLWDLATGAAVRTIKLDSTPCGICWFPDSKRLVTNASDGAAVWDITTRKPSRALGERERGRYGGDVVISAEGFIAGQVNDTQLDLWDLEGKRLERLDLKQKIGVTSIAVVPGGLLVGTRGDCALRFAVTV
jgi:predicted DNA-binding WGR domain protein